MRYLRSPWFLPWWLPFSRSTSTAENECVRNSKYQPWPNTPPLRIQKAGSTRRKVPRAGRAAVLTVRKAQHTWGWKDTHLFTKELPQRVWSSTSMVRHVSQKSVLPLLYLEMVIIAFKTFYYTAIPEKVTFFEAKKGLKSYDRHTANSAWGQDGSVCWGYSGLPSIPEAKNQCPQHSYCGLTHL